MNVLKYTLLMLGLLLISTLSAEELSSLQLFYIFLCSCHVTL